MGLGTAILSITAIFLPPLAVFLKTASCGQLFINLILTCLGYIPGIIHALHIVTKTHTTGTGGVVYYEKPKKRRWYVAPMSAGAAAGGGTC